MLVALSRPLRRPPGAVLRLHLRRAAARAAAPQSADTAAEADDTMGGSAAPRPRFTPAEFVVDKADAFSSLQLRTIADEVGGVRVRQHVNPLSARYCAVVPPPPWATLFEDASLPLVLDLGCGSGRFLLALADKDATAADATPAPRRNYLGIEIREPLVARAQSWAEKKGMDKRVRYEATNANVNAPAWLQAYPGPLQLVSILHPDPHWKRKHHKRRIVQPALARAIAERLAPGGQLFLQSDVKAVAEDMVSVFETVAGADLLELAPVHFGPGASPDWPPPEAARINQGDDEQREAARAAARRKARKTAAGSDAASAGAGAAAEDADAGDDTSSDEEEGPTGWAARPGNGWLRDNPVGVPTERELGTVAAGGHCWRALLQRRAAA